MMHILALANPLEHVIDKNILNIGEFTVSNATVMLVLAGLLTVVVMLLAASRIATGKTGTLEDLQSKGTLANLVEAVCLYLRDEVFHPVLGDDTDKYTPMLWTMFWFILICNLLGLVPLADWSQPIVGSWNHGHGIGGTATQSIWVTAALATVAFVWFNGVAIVKDPIGFLKHLTAGAPIFMWPIMIPVEILGTFVKPVALALRLFANMTGGHIIVATLLGFVGALWNLENVMLKGMAIVPLVGTVVIYFLEIMVCFIQAYVFTFLSCLFLGQLVVHHDHDEEHGEHAH